MTVLTVATLKLFGGHPALDFTNTVDGRGPVPGPDVLRSYGDLLDWAVRLRILGEDEAGGLRGSDPDAGARALDHAKRFREALYRILSDRSAARRDDLDCVQQTISEAQAARRLDAGKDGFVWRWREDDLDTVTHRVALAAAELLASSALTRTRVCASETCRWLFLDQSRPGRRIWCSDEGCGTANRVRRWRRKQGV